ncbi:MAG: oligosaccharide flippase family protein [Siphonobacter aquaeclarae]|nr:oligosaccharide flippase family protein [Siphonobacter aquaeclarae]
MRSNQGLYLNFLYTLFVQSSNLLVPLILIPFLVKKAGMTGFAVLALAQSVMANISVFVDYGFSIVAVQEVVTNRSDNAKLGRIAGTVFVCKGLIAVACFLCLVAYLAFTGSHEWTVYLTSYLLVVAQAISPFWFFQAVDNLKWISTVIALGRILAFFLILWFVPAFGLPEYVNAILGIGNLLASLYAFYQMSHKYHVVPSLPSFAMIWASYRSGWHLFTSTVATALYLQSSLLFIGFFSNALWVGYYAAVEKIATILRQALVVFSQVTFPKVCQIERTSKSEAILFYKHAFLPFLAAITVACVVLFVGAPFLVHDLLKIDAPESVVILRILSLVPAAVCVGIPYSHWVVLHYPKSKFNQITWMTLLVFVLSSILLVPLFNGYGAAVAVLLAEISSVAMLVWLVEVSSKDSFLFRFIVDKMKVL